MKHKLMQVMLLREAARQLDGRVEVDDAYLGGELPGGKSGRGSENKVSFIAAVQTTPTGHAVLVCLRKLEFTKEAIAQWARTSLCASAQVVSDGLWCFQAVNTLLGNLKTAFSGTYHSFDFVKYAQVQYRFNRRFDLRSILSRLRLRSSTPGTRHAVG